MNRVLLCGACVAAVRRLMEKDCAQVAVVTATDGTITTKVQVTESQKKKDSAEAKICRAGVCYLANAAWNPEPGVTLEFLRKTEPTVMTRLMERHPGLVCLLMQNISLQLKTQGVLVRVDVVPELEV